MYRQLSLFPELIAHDPPDEFSTNYKILLNRINKVIEEEAYGLLGPSRPIDLGQQLDNYVANVSATPGVESVTARIDPNNPDTILANITIQPLQPLNFTFDTETFDVTITEEEE